MKLLIKQACITDPLSSHHGTIQDILIEKGMIREIAPSISEKADQVIEGKGSAGQSGMGRYLFQFC